MQRINDIPRVKPANRLLKLLSSLLLLLLAGCTSTIGPESVLAPTATTAPALPTVTTAPDATASTEQTPPEAVPSFSPDQTVLQLDPSVTDLDAPVFVANAGDGSGRVFIVEKPGAIRIFSDGQLQATPFVDLRDRVGSSGNEQGLLGLAFAPNYAESGYFFVNYTDRSGNTLVSRFQVSPDDPNRADPDSESNVLQIDQPARNHNGGMLAFGPDGYLYIGTGDGGAANDRFDNGQNPDSLLGKMLRLDVTSDPSIPYAIPLTNPWVEQDWNGEDVRDEIWAVGLRNPWRFSFDRQTGELWIADVGQNMFEEVNLTPAGSQGGLNFGWPIMEGFHCFRDPSGCDSDGLVLPMIEYPHEGHCSVTGGYVYRGVQFPELQGVYFFGDYCSGTIWAATPDGAGGITYDQVLDSGLQLSSFGEGETGELYVTDLGGGVIYQLVVGQE